MNKVCRLKFIAQCSCMDTLAKTYDKTRNCHVRLKDQGMKGF